MTISDTWVSTRRSRSVFIAASTCCCRSIVLRWPKSRRRAAWKTSERATLTSVMEMPFGRSANRTLGDGCIFVRTAQKATAAKP